MKKTLKAILSFVMILAVCLSVFVTNVSAAANVALSVPTSIAVGETITVTVKYTGDRAIKGLDTWLEYDKTVLQYVPNSATWTACAMVNANDPGGIVKVSWLFTDSTLKTITFTYKLKAIKAGATNVSVITDSLSHDKLGTPETPPAKKSVAVSVVNYVASSNNNLKSVDIGVAAENGASLGRGTLTPAFNKNTTTYTLKVPYNTHSVSLTGNKEDTKATTKVGGAWASNADKWTRTITVTAENGKTKVYTFNIVREAKPQGNTSSTPSTKPPVSSDPVVSEPEIDENLQVIVDDETYYINTVLSDNNKPSGFTASISTYNGVEIPVFVSADEKMKVALLTNGEKEDSLFIYNSEKINFTKVDYIDFGGKKYIPDDFTIYTDEYSEYGAAAAEIFGKNINSFKVEETSEYLYFWAVNSEGVGAVYSYDTIEKTMQRANLTVKENTSSNDEIVDAPAVDPLSKGISPITFATTVAILVVIILVLVVVTFVALCKAKEAKQQPIQPRTVTKPLA